MRKPAKLPPPLPSLKPTKPPPPPPPPPRRRSPTHSCCSRYAHSENAESVSSVPLSTRSLQPHLNLCSPGSSHYCSCQSEPVNRINLIGPGSPFCRKVCCQSSVTSYVSPYCGDCNQCQPTCHHLHCPINAGCNSTIPSHSPSPSSHSHHSNFTTPSNHGFPQICLPISPHTIRRCDKPLPQAPVQVPAPISTTLQERRPSANNFNNIDNNNYKPNHRNQLDVVDTSQQIVKKIPPTPKERTPRPRLSVSPMPTLKDGLSRPSLKETKLPIKCKSIHYRGHMEQYIENLFKYLRDREQRRAVWERDIPSDERSDAVLTIRNLQNRKESQYLRSLRTRMSRSDFIWMKPLGRGAIGEVWLVKKNSNLTLGSIERPLHEHQPALYAMKVVKTRQVYLQGHMAHVKAERDILAEADNDWIVKLFYSFQDKENLYFILEYIPGGDMMGLLSKLNVFTESMARFYIAEISLALQFVHDMGFIHRDIKPDNILIDANGHIKLTDFGLCTGFRWTHDSRYYKDDTSNSNINSYDDNYYAPDEVLNNFEDHPTITKALTQREIEHSSRRRCLSLVGSPNYIAPEVLRQAICRRESTNEKLCDWWSVGVILYEMVIGYCPFIDVQKLKQGNNCYKPEEDHPANIQTRILNWQNNLAFPNYISDEVRNVMQRLLCEPEHRLCQNGIVDLKEHPFFNGVDWQNIRNLEAPYIPELSNPEDTRHFDPFVQQPPERENISNSGSIRMAPMNGFTYKNFYKN